MRTFKMPAMSVLTTNRGALLHPGQRNLAAQRRLAACGSAQRKAGSWRKAAACCLNILSGPAGQDVYAVDFQATTGDRNRWWELSGALHQTVEYHDREAAAQHLLVYLPHRWSATWKLPVR